MKTEMKEINKMKTPKIVGADCDDINCPFHGTLSTRGRGFQGKVVRKFHKRVVIEFERTIYVKKYERFAKLKTRIHARLPICIEKNINFGDYVRIEECRPLSKLIHFVVVEKINSGENRK